MNKVILLVILLIMTAYSQFFENSGCDSIFSIYSGCFTVDKTPEIIGGLDSLQSKIIYPQEALKNNIEGKVYILAIIDSTGTLLCSNVIKGLGYGCDEEA